jgi:protein-disulfide isomerase
MARDAGVLNPVAFSECIAQTGAVRAIEVDKALAEDMRLRGTPTLVLDGQDLSTVDSVGLMAAVEEFLLSRGD